MDRSVALAARPSVVSVVVFSAVLVGAGCGSVSTGEADAAEGLTDASARADASVTAADASPPADGPTASDAALPDAGGEPGDLLPQRCVRATTSTARFTVCGNVDALTWTQADAFCEDELDARLARIDSEEENILIHALGRHVAVAGGGRHDSTSVGGTDEGEEGVWRWLTGEPTVFWLGGSNGAPQNELYTNWRAGEPNDTNGEEDYLVVNDVGLWNDLADRASESFACGDEAEVSQLADHCYMLETRTATYAVCRQPVDREFNWIGVREFCQDHGMELAEVRSQGEHDVLVAAARGWSLGGKVAIGGSDAESEGIWRWVGTGDIFWVGAADGSAQGGAYTNWVSGEPNNQGGAQDYLYIDMPRSGRWDDGALGGVSDDGGWVCQQLE
jgi:hypothetical protein